MTNFAQREANRLRVLLEIYGQTEDDTRKFVSLWDIREALGLTDDEMANAVDFLESRRLIRPLRTLGGQRTPGQTRITQAGVAQMERTEKAAQPMFFSELNPVLLKSAQRLQQDYGITEPGVRAVVEAKKTPDKPTAGFPSYFSVQNATFVMAPMTNSSVQNAGDRAKLKSKIKVTGIDPRTRAGVEDFVRLYEENQVQLAQEQTPKAVEVIAKKVDEMQQQLGSPETKKRKLKKAAESLREILEVGVGGAVTVYLLAALHRIPW